jgi:glutamate racemase
VAPIGIFDSGVGGLTVVRHLRALLPAEDLLYLADQAHVPYGRRPAAEVARLSAGITRFFLTHGAKLIVVACNTASAAALTGLRAAFPALPFVGMEPAVKPGANSTRSGVVGVMATAGTFESQRYASLMKRYAGDITLLEDPCAGLVELIEAGETASPRTDALLQRVLEPMLAAGMDTLILGCTHYPFADEAIRRVVGPEVYIIDPAPAVARQARRMLVAADHLAPDGDEGSVRLFTSGDPARFAAQAAALLGEVWPVAGVGWQGGEVAPRFTNPFSPV